MYIGLLFFSFLKCFPSFWSSEEKHYLDPRSLSFGFYKIIWALLPSITRCCSRDKERKWEHYVVVSEKQALFKEIVWITSLGKCLNGFRHPRRWELIRKTRLILNKIKKLYFLCTSMLWSKQIPVPVTNLKIFHLVLILEHTLIRN